MIYCSCTIAIDAFGAVVSEGLAVVFEEVVAAVFEEVAVAGVWAAIVAGDVMAVAVPVVVFVAFGISFYPDISVVHILADSSCIYTNCWDSYFPLDKHLCMTGWWAAGCCGYWFEGNYMNSGTNSWEYLYITTGTFVGRGLPCWDVRGVRASIHILSYG